MDPNLTWMDQVRDILTQFQQVDLAYLFGSRLTGKSGVNSDLDLAVSFYIREELENTLAGLAHAVHKRLPEMGRVDLIDLSTSPLELKYSIIVSGRCIFQKDAATRVEFEADVLSRYFDYLPVLRQQRRDVLSEEDYDRRIQRYRKALERTQRTLGEALSAAKQKSPGI